MKPKIFKTKSIIALALALLMVMPILMAAVPYVKADESGATPVLSIVPTGAAGSLVTSYIPGSAIGSQFTVDIRLDNISQVSGGINGATYGVTWNPLVLQLDPVNQPVDGACWGSKTLIASTQVSSSNYDFNQIINDASNSVLGDGIHGRTVSTTGYVVGQITFDVIGSGQSNIAFDQSSDLLYIAGPTVGNLLPPTALILGGQAIYNLTQTTISAVLSGTGGTTNTPSVSSVPIGNTFSVDLYMNNELNEPVWAWNLNVNWTPSVLQLETITEGNYLSATNTGLHDGAATLFVPGWIDNTAGTVQQGISDVYLSNTTDTNMAGVMCTLTFEVINYASSAITVSAGTTSSGTLVDTYGHSQGVNAFSSFMYIGGQAPAATAPVAAFTATPASYQASQTIQLNAASSVAGNDPLANPLNPTVPITSYAWTVTDPSVAGYGTITLTGVNPSFNAPGQVNGNIHVVLTVTTATTTDGSYVNTNSASLDIAPGILPPGNNGAMLDLYIVNNGTGTTYPTKTPTGVGVSNSIVDSFAPQQAMNLGAYVTFNNGEVSDKLVTFTITNATNPSQVIAIFTAMTNESTGVGADGGIATAQYRLPNANSLVMPFGTYTITATVDVAQVIVSDSITFSYGYTLTLGHVSITQLVARGRDSAFMSVPITNISPNPAGQTYYITYTVTDVNGVPIFSSQAPVGAQVATAAPQVAGGSTVTISGSYTIPIPDYAFAGQATVHVNIFNANPSVPSQNALPYCPESDATFTIGLTPGS